jgi:hypothetical protein
MRQAEARIVMILIILTVVCAPPCGNPVAPHAPDVYLACESDEM